VARAPEPNSTWRFLISRKGMQLLISMLGVRGSADVRGT
jgi:hypothetical protein